MRFRSIFVLALLSLTVASCTRKNRNVVLAQVGEHKLMSDEFASLLASRIKKFNIIEIKNANTLATVKNQIVNEFINDSLFIIWGKQNNIRVTEPEVLEELKKVRSNYKTDLSFSEALSNSDTTLKQLKINLRNSLIKNKVFDQLRKDIPQPKEPEIKAYFDEHKEDFKTKPKLRIEQIILEKKEDADLTLEQLSSGNIPEKVKQQLEYHWIHEEGLEVFKNAFDMKLNEWSPVLKSEYGYHIYRVLLKEGEKYLSFESSKDLIRKRLVEVRMQAKYSDWLERMLKSTEISKNDEALKNVVVEVS